MEYFLGSVKIMLIVYALAAFIAMLTAWIIKLIFAGIRSQRTPVAAPGDTAAKVLPKAANDAPGKAS